MRNLIYACVFRSREYIKLFQYLAESIAAYGEVPADTDFLVFTQPDFEEDIRRIANVDIHLCTMDSVFECGRSKLRIFEHDLSKYDKILYLDTDVLVDGPLASIFSLDIAPDKLYALEEGVVSHEFWGGETPLFDLTLIDRNTTAFSSGVLFFRNSSEMRDLFMQMNTRIDLDVYEKKIPISGCLEQPFVNYCAIMSGRYNNQLLKSFVQNNPVNLTQGIAVYHFPGGPGWYWRKLPAMEDFQKLMRGSRSLKPRLIGKTYDWGPENSITFCETHLSTFFGQVRDGNTYRALNENVVEVYFGGFHHILVFNETLTEFTSIRKVDFQITNCRIKNGSMRGCKEEGIP